MFTYDVYHGKEKWRHDDFKRRQLRVNFEILVSITFEVIEKGGVSLQGESMVLHSRYISMYSEAKSCDEGNFEFLQDEACDDDVAGKKKLEKHTIRGTAGEELIDLDSVIFLNNQKKKKKKTEVKILLKVSSKRTDRSALSQKMRGLDPESRDQLYGLVAPFFSVCILTHKVASAEPL